MNIRLNGSLRSIREGITLADLLQELKIDFKDVVLEYNGHFLQAENKPAALLLSEGDALEIVHFVGGG